MSASRTGQLQKKANLPKDRDAKSRVFPCTRISSSRRTGMIAGLPKLDRAYLSLGFPALRKLLPRHILVLECGSVQYQNQILLYESQKYKPACAAADHSLVPWPHPVKSSQSHYCLR
jgi:hypothetical protein